MSKHLLPIEDGKKLRGFYALTPHPKLELNSEFFVDNVARRIYSEWQPEVMNVLSSNCPTLGFETFVRDETHYECERRQKAGQNDVWTAR